MTELGARLPRPSRLPFLLGLAAAAALAATLAVVLGGRHPHAHAHRLGQARPVPQEGAPAPAAEPPAHLPAEVLDAEAAQGFSRGFFVSSRRGVEATAARVLAWRRLAARAAAGTTIDANLLEGMIDVESAGVAGAVAGNRAGLTQLTPVQARLGGLHVNVRRSRSLTPQIVWWAHHGNDREARRLARLRARADRRFAPLAELRATVRWLERAQRSLGDIDLAVAAKHLGVSGLRGTLARYGGEGASYADLYFGSAPDRRPAVYRRLTAHGQAAYDYPWRVLAAERVLRLAATAPRRLAWEDRQQHRKNSAEEVLHPRPVSHEFRTPQQLAAAWRRGLLHWIPNDPARTHVRVSHLGTMVRLRERKLYHGLRRGALDVLFLLGSRVHRLAGGPPLVVTSAVRDDTYQAALQGVNAFAARTYSTHTTGFTFDLARQTLGARQETALRWVLDRLTALNAVAYIEEPYCFHVTVASRAVNELGLLRAVA